MGRGNGTESRHGEFAPRGSSFRFYVGEEPPVFVEASEAMVAALLEQFGIAWLYEPHTFTLEVDDSGAVVEAFTPDFYLPEKGIYIECSVMRPTLRTRKNRKVRRVRELHGVKVKGCYTRQLRWLAERYGFDPEVYAMSHYEQRRRANASSENPDVAVATTTSPS